MNWRDSFTEDELKILDMVHDRVNKICDVCDTVYPGNYTDCLYKREIKINGKIINCQDKKLRAFKIHNNMDELSKNWK